MSQPVILNNVDHGDLRVRLGQGEAYGDAVNQVLAFPTEFEALQRHYPILFRRTDAGRYRAVALLGLDPGENLFLEGERWAADYVPAIQQRGPFSIGLQREGDGGIGAEPLVHVDLSHPRITRGDGEPLFLPHGGHAPYLQHVTRILALMHDGVGVAGPMFAAFEEHGLIQPIDLRIELDDGLRYDVGDCSTIGQEALAGLTGDALAALNRAGFLRLAFLVAASLANVSRLVDRKLARRAAAG